MSRSLPKMNKAIAGFHLLMIISAADHKLAFQEDLVISDYISKEFPFRLNMDREIQILSNLKVEEWMDHFEICMFDFENDATIEEKNTFLQFAIDLTKADNIISKSENVYLDKLFKNWFPE